MVRLLSGFLLALAFCTAYAQTGEAPTEKANLATVVIFLVLFVAACVGYVGYAWWAGKKKKKEGEDQ